MRTATDKEVSSVQAMQMPVQSLEDKQVSVTNVSDSLHLSQKKEIISVGKRGVHSKLRRKLEVNVSSPNKPH